MAHSNVWSNIIPAGSDALNTADDQIRQLRLDIQERMDEVVDDWTTDPVVPKTLAIGRLTGTPVLAVVYTGAAFNLASGGVPGTTIDWVGETLDTGAFHDNSVNPSRLTIATAGYYRIHSSLQVTPDSTPAAGNVLLRKNGTTIAMTRRIFQASILDHVAISYIDLAAVDDYYQINFVQASGDAWTTDNDADECWFMIEKLIGTT